MTRAELEYVAAGLRRTLAKAAEIEAGPHDGRYPAMVGWLQGGMESALAELERRLKEDGTRGQTRVAEVLAQARWDGQRRDYLNDDAGEEPRP